MQSLRVARYLLHTQLSDATGCLAVLMLGFGNIPQIVRQARFTGYNGKSVISRGELMENRSAVSIGAP